jgi:uridine kinase
VTVPIYNFSTHSREEKTVTIYGANVIIFEGILALYDKRIRDMMDVKVGPSYFSKGKYLTIYNRSLWIRMQIFSWQDDYREIQPIEDVM